MNPLLAAVNLGNTPLSTDPNKSVTVSQAFPDVATLVNIILKNSLTIAGIILVFLLIFGGIMFIISAGSGDQKKSQQSKSMITSALIGFVVVLCAYFIIQIIQVLTGLNIL